MAESLKLYAGIRKTASSKPDRRRRIEPKITHGPDDLIHDRDALRRAERLYLDAHYPEFANPTGSANPNDPNGTDRDDLISRFPVPEPDDSTTAHELTDPSWADQVNSEEQVFYHQVMAQLAALEAGQAELWRRIGPSNEPSTGLGRDFDNDGHGDHSHRAAVGPGDGPGDADSLETPMVRQPPELLIHRIVLPAVFALALPMFAGTVAVLVFAPADRPAEVIVDGGSKIREPDLSAAASSVPIEPTAVRPQNNALRDSIIGTDVPIGLTQISPEGPEGGVTKLRPSISPPTSTGSVVTPIQPALVNSVPAVAKANTSGNLAPLVSDVEPVASPVRGEVMAPSPASQSARATTDVNMRAGPSTNQPIITVVPAKASIELVACEAWCEVIFDGQRGWIHNKFVDRSGAAAVSGSG